MSNPLNMCFLCVHNHCRSQMAEAFARHFGGDRVVAQSAGVQTCDIHPLAIEVMKEVGIDISEQRSKRIDMETFINANVVVKLCQEIHEKCPAVPFWIRNVRWNIPDPSQQSGGTPSIEEFRKVRDLIKDRVVALLMDMKVLSDEEVLHAAYS